MIETSPLGKPAIRAARHFRRRRARRDEAGQGRRCSSSCSNTASTISIPRRPTAIRNCASVRGCASIASDFFLATKTGDRTYEGARDSLHRSLERLRVDQVDLIQLHNLVEEDEWQTALGSARRAGGAGRGARAGTGAVHRRDRPRLAGRRDASPQPGAVRIRLGAVSLQLHDAGISISTTPTSKRCSRSAMSAASRRRRSSRSRAGDGKMATAASSVGTSRCASATRCAARFISC